MATPSEGWYDADIVCAFIESLREGGKVNGYTLYKADREKLKRWAEAGTIPLGRVDAFLHRYELMTWELEDWATQHHGHCGYIEAVAA